MVKQQLSYFSHILMKTTSLENSIMLGKCEGEKEAREATEKMAGRDSIEAIGRRLPRLRETVRSRTEWRAGRDSRGSRSEATTTEGDGQE